MSRPAAASPCEHWYVYYPVPAALGAQAQRCAHDTLAGVAATTGVRGAVQERVERPDGRRTFMEVYPSVGAPEPFGAALGAAVQAANWPIELAGARRTERFVDLGAGA